MSRFRPILVAIACTLGLGVSACEDDDSPDAQVTAGTTTADAARSPATSPPVPQIATREAPMPATPSPSPGTNDQPAATSTPATVAPTSAPQPSPTPTTTAVGATPEVLAALGDLRNRLSVASGVIQVVSADEVEWSDGSLGCPQPGMLYTQAIVSGYRIILRHNGADYAYHGRLNGTPFYCANP